MFELRQITDPSSEDFSVAWKMYQSSFSAYERRRLSAQRECFKSPNYKLYVVDCAGEIIGLLSEWEFEKFVLVEHFTIKKQARNKGVGRKVLKDYFASKDKVVLTEIERPKTEDDSRKMSFLRELDVKLNHFTYSHPTYSDKKRKIQVFLVSYPRKISKREYEAIRDEIQTKLFF